MAWYNASWLHRKKIIVDHTKVGASLSDYPIYLNLADLGATFFANVLNEGGDIRITDEDGTTELAREVVSCVTASSTGEVHFKAAAPSNSVDSVYYIYYGNSAASNYAVTDTYGARAVWSNSFVGVWHLQSNGTNSVSASYNVTAGGTPTATQGKLGGVGSAYSFNGTNQYFQASVTPVTARGFTMSAWAQSSSTTLDEQAICGMEHTVGGNQTRYALELLLGDESDLYAVLYDNTPEGLIDDLLLTGANNIIGANFHYICGLWTSQTSHTLYVDDSAAVTDTATDCGAYDAINRLAFGRVYNADGAFGYLAGKIDEVRLSDTARSAAWKTTDYNNQNSSSTFYTIGGEETFMIPRISIW